jgi:hypothetical protein
MKNSIVIALVLLFVFTGYSQKKKVPVKTATTSSKGVLAKSENLVAEIKSGNFQVTIDGKESIIIKAVDAKFNPIDVKLVPFISGGAKLYMLAWTEKSLTKTDVKSEDITTLITIIYDIPNKKEVFSNTQLTNHIIEKVFLDRLKNASETQERMRREGFEFILNPDGTIIQKNKTQENRWVYDAAKMEFVDAKKKKK